MGALVANSQTQTPRNKTYNLYKQLYYCITSTCTSLHDLYSPESTIPTIYQVESTQKKGTVALFGPERHLCFVPGTVTYMHAANLPDPQGQVHRRNHALSLTPSPP